MLVNSIVAQLRQVLALLFGDDEMLASRRYRYEEEAAISCCLFFKKGAGIPIPFTG
jgi:hypothetical protein